MYEKREICMMIPCIQNIIFHVNKIYVWNVVYKIPLITHERGVDPIGDVIGALLDGVTLVA